MNECEEILVTTNEVIHVGAYVITEKLNGNQKIITTEENINRLCGRIK